MSCFLSFYYVFFSHEAKFLKPYISVLDLALHLPTEIMSTQPTFDVPGSPVDITAHIITIKKNISQIGSGLTEQFVLDLRQLVLNF